MNVNDVKKYMIDADRKVLGRVLDFGNIIFTGSNDDGIIVDLKDGQHTLNIGNNVNEAQIQRVLVLLTLDTVMNVKNEDDRDNLGEYSYNEYGDRVSLIQSKFFSSKRVFLENQGVIVSDDIIECRENMCKLRKYGNVDRSNLIGLSHNESKISKK